MARMNSGIILAGQQPDPVNALARAAGAARLTNATTDQNRLRQLYMAQGDKILAGDDNAINALARIGGPEAALGVRAGREQLQASAEMREQRRMLARQRAAEYADTIDAKKAAQEAAELNALHNKAMGAALRNDLVDLNVTMAEMGYGPVESPQEYIDGYALMNEEAFAILKRRADLAPKGPLVDFSNANIGSTAPQEERPIVGPPEKGFQRRYDPELKTFVDEPIPGSSPAQDIAETSQKTEERGRVAEIKRGDLLQVLQKQRAEVNDGGWPVTGAIGVTTGLIPGTAAHDFKIRNNRIRAKAAFDELQNMRENSPTGGAVGQLSDAEREALTDAEAAIYQSASKEEYMRALNAFENKMLDIAYGDGNWARDPKTGKITVKVEEQGDALGAAGDDTLGGGDTGRGGAQDTIPFGGEPAQPVFNPDGTIGEVPEGFEYDQQTGQMVDVGQRAQAQEQLLQEHPYASRAVEFVQGAPFVGEWLDEGVQKISPEAAGKMRAMSDAMEARRPGQSIGLNIAGGIAATAPLLGTAAAAKGAEFVGRAASPIMRVVRALGLGAPAGAVEGAATMSGRAQPGERLAAAREGAAVGVALGGAAGALGSLIGEAGTAAHKWWRRMDVSAISDEFGLSPAAASQVREALVNDDLGEAVRRLSVLGDDAMLADSGLATGQLFDAATATGGAALRTAREGVDQRAKGSWPRLMNSLDVLMGKPAGVKATAREIAASTRAARQEAYDAAYSTAIDYSSKQGRNIESVLDRIPPRILRDAIETANDQMRVDGVKNMQIMAQIADDGSVSFKSMPNVQQLDEIAKALGDVGQRNVDQFGRPTSVGVNARRLRTDLRGALKEAVPPYSKALFLGGDKIRRDEGLDLGKRLLFRSTEVEDVKAFMNEGVTKETREAMRTGLRAAIEKNMGEVRRTITDPNTDIREVMQLVKEMSSRNNIEKVSMVLGKVRADRLMAELDRHAAVLQLRAVISVNSKTAIRQAIQAQGAAAAQPNLMTRAVGEMPNPFDVGQELTRELMGTSRRATTAREKAMFDEIAKALVNIRGEDAQRALAAVQGAINGQPLLDAQAELIGKVIGRASGGLTYQGTKQPSTRQ